MPGPAPKGELTLKPDTHQARFVGWLGANYARGLTFIIAQADRKLQSFCEVAKRSIRPRKMLLPFLTELS